MSEVLRSFKPNELVIWAILIEGRKGTVGKIVEGGFEGKIVIIEELGAISATIGEFLKVEVKTAHQTYLKAVPYHFYSAENPRRRLGLAHSIETLHYTRAEETFNNERLQLQKKHPPSKLQINTFTDQTGHTHVTYQHR